MSNVLMSINLDGSVVLKDIHGNLLYPVTKVQYVEGLGTENVNVLGTGDSRLVNYFAYKNGEDIRYVTEEDSKKINTPITVYRIDNNKMVVYSNGFMNSNNELIINYVVHVADINKNYKVIDTSDYILVQDSVPPTGYLASYKLYKDNLPVSTNPVINVPEGSKLTKAELVKISDKYNLRFTIKNLTKNNPTGIEEYLYVDLSDISNVYRPGNGLSLDNDKKFNVEVDTGIKISSYNGKVIFDKNEQSIIAGGTDGITEGTNGTVPSPKPTERNCVLTSNKDSNNRVSWVQGLTYTEVL